MKATKADKIIILALFILTMMSFNLKAYFNTAGADALLYIDGRLAYKLALNVDREYNIPVKNGTMAVKVADGKLYISDAPCPRKICVNASPAFKKGESLICVPNAFIIKIDGGGEEGLDTVTK